MAAPTGNVDGSKGITLSHDTGTTPAGENVGLPTKKRALSGVNLLLTLQMKDSVPTTASIAEERTTISGFITPEETKKILEMIHSDLQKGPGGAYSSSLVHDIADNSHCITLEDLKALAALEALQR